MKRLSVKFMPDMTMLTGASCLAVVTIGMNVGASENDVT